MKNGEKDKCVKIVKGKNRQIKIFETYQLRRPSSIAAESKSASDVIALNDGRNTTAETAQLVSRRLPAKDLVWFSVDKFNFYQQ